MPHCIIEHSSAMNPQTLIDAVHQGAIDSQLFDTAAIKTRTINYEYHRCDDNVDEFVHVNCKILSGRTAKQKDELSKAVLKRLADCGFTNISITVEISDLNKACYSKKVC